MSRYPKMSHSESWRFTHKGVECKVYRRPAFDGMCRKWDWCHYISLREQQLPRARGGLDRPVGVERWFLPPCADDKGRVWYDYYNSPWADLAWEGGCTFYTIHGQVLGHRVAEAGCDYQHSWDEGVEYDLDWVARNATKSAQSLIDAIPEIRVRCAYNGRYYDASVMEPWGEGFISPEGRAQRDKQFPDAPTPGVPA